MKRITLLLLIISFVMVGCFRQSPTSANQPAGLALQLQVADWTLLEPDQPNALGRSHAPTQVTRVEIYIVSERDTLTRATVPISPEAAEFAASLEVPAGENRRVVVEAWDDLGSGGTQAGLILRGVQEGVTIVPDLVQTVALTLYPVPVAGQRVVLALGSASGAPGTSGHLVPLTLVSADSLSGMQFDLNFNPAVLTPQGIIPDPALPWSNVESNLVNNGQALRILMFDSNSRRLPAYPNPKAIASVDFRVSVEAALGGSPLALSSAIVLDANRNQLEVAAVHDTFYVVAGK